MICHASFPSSVDRKAPKVSTLADLTNDGFMTDATDVS